MPVTRNTLEDAKFNPEATLPYELRLDDFRRNARGELGTRTATLHAQGVAKLRNNWIYRIGRVAAPPTLNEAPPAAPQGEGARRSRP
jgi:hypothetical protein